MTPRGMAKVTGWWLAILVMANINGALREFVLVPNMGAGTAHSVSTLLLIAVVLAVSLAAVRTVRMLDTPRSQWWTGVYWLGLTLAFEFLAGHFVFGQSWEALVSAYYVWEGRLWPLVPLAVLAGPRLAGRWMAKSAS